MTHKAIIWSKENCPGCSQAKALFKVKKIEFEERLLGNPWTKEDLLQAVPNARTVPQIFLNNEYIGGIDALQKRLYAN